MMLNILYDRIIASVQLNQPSIGHHVYRECLNKCEIRIL